MTRFIYEGSEQFDPNYRENLAQVERCMECPLFMEAECGVGSNTTRMVEAEVDRDKNLSEAERVGRFDMEVYEPAIKSATERCADDPEKLQNTLKWLSETLIEPTAAMAESNKRSYEDRAAANQRRADEFAGKVATANEFLDGVRENPCQGPKNKFLRPFLGAKACNAEVDPESKLAMEETYREAVALRKSLGYRGKL